MHILSRDLTSILLAFFVVSTIFLHIEEDCSLTPVLSISCCLLGLEMTWIDAFEYVKLGWHKTSDIASWKLLIWIRWFWVPITRDGNIIMCFGGTLDWSVVVFHLFCYGGSWSFVVKSFGWRMIVCGDPHTSSGICSIALPSIDLLCKCPRGRSCTWGGWKINMLLVKASIISYMDWLKCLSKLYVILFTDIKSQYRMFHYDWCFAYNHEYAWSCRKWNPIYFCM